MATINEQFIQVKTKANFESRLSTGDVKDTSIAFIEDTNEIWAKGHYYPCSYSDTEITNLLNNKVDKESGKSLVADELITKLTGLDDQNTIDAAINAVQSNLTTHINDKDNPHEVTKALIGLSNVDNTSDANKPISTATQTALNNKVDKTTTVNGHALSENVTVTKADVGLGNVDNTADLDKPISTATQNALNGKVDKEPNKSLVSNDLITKLEELDDQDTIDAAIADKIPLSLKGTANGVATLTENGKVPASQLPTYVDDVLEGTLVSTTDFTLNEGQLGEVKLSGVVYIDTTTNKSYRWSGSQYVMTGSDLALGETSSTAYAGDKGKQVTDRVAEVYSANSVVNGLSDITFDSDDTGAQTLSADNALKTWDGSGTQHDIKIPYATASKAGVMSAVDKQLLDNLSDNYLPLSGGTMSGNIVFGDNTDYEYVDLGLPSGLLWAKYNVGATSEEEAGLYFQWGDTQGYTAEQVGYGEGLKPFDVGDYKFSIDGSSSNLSKYNESDGKVVLDPEDDAAHVNMGGNWRMPTFEEYKELCLNTDIYLVPTEGEEIQGTAQEQPSESLGIDWASQARGTLKGVKFYKKGDKQTYMFVPASGFANGGSIIGVGDNGSVWASSLRSLVSSAYQFGFSPYSGSVGNSDRCYGYPVRGVCNSLTTGGIIINNKSDLDLINAAGGTTSIQDIVLMSTDYTDAKLQEINSTINAKQDTLVSGTNIKTINNESLLGSGNITITSGLTYGPATASSLGLVMIPTSSYLRVSEDGSLDISELSLSTRVRALILEASISWNLIISMPSWIENKEILWSDISHILPATRSIEGVVRLGTEENPANLGNVYPVGKLTNRLHVGIPTVTTETNGIMSSTDKSKLDNFGKVNKVTTTTRVVTQEIQPNQFYEFGEVTSLTITLANQASGYIGEYQFQFTSGSTPATLNLPENISYMVAPDFQIEANKTYQVSILNNVAVIGGY